MNIEELLLVGAAGFVVVNLNMLIARPLNRLLKNRYRIYWGQIILNAIAALVLGIGIALLDPTEFLFDLICFTAIGSLGSTYFFISSEIFRIYTLKRTRIIRLISLLGEIVVDALLIHGGTILATYFPG